MLLMSSAYFLSLKKSSTLTLQLYDIITVTAACVLNLKLKYCFL